MSTPIRPGDMVLVDDGIEYIAVVLGREGRRLRVRPWGERRTPAPIPVSWVVGHWRPARRGSGDRAVKLAQRLLARTSGPSPLETAGSAPSPLRARASARATAGRGS